MNVGLRAVAEGGENADQQHALTALGCAYGQGYYLARPVPRAEIEGRLTGQGLPGIEDVHVNAATPS